MVGDSFPKESAAADFFFFIRAKPQRNLTALFLFFLASRFLIGGTPYLVHCLTAAGRSLFSFSRKGAKPQRNCNLPLGSFFLPLISCFSSVLLLATCLPSTAADRILKQPTAVREVSLEHLPLSPRLLGASGYHILTGKL